MSAPRWFSYQWMRDGAPIRGAVSASYTLQDGDVGKVIAVNVVASNYAGEGSAYVSLSTFQLQGALAVVEDGDTSNIVAKQFHGTIDAVEDQDVANFKGLPHGRLFVTETPDDATFAGTRA